MQRSISNHDLAPLRINARTWWKLEKRFGKKLVNSAREEIVAAADQFAITQHFYIVDRARHKLRGSRSEPTSISKLRTNLVRVQKLWGDIQNDPTAQQFFWDVSNDLELGDVDDIMWQLQYLNVGLDAYMEPPNFVPFRRYVKKISGIYERVTEKSVTIMVPGDASMKTSPFIEVMKTLDTTLPKYAQQSMIRRSKGKRSKRKRPTIAAWAQALIRARK